MTQILHIFRKDARQFWPEIAVSVAITAALVWFYPLRWTTLPAMSVKGSANLTLLGNVLAGLVITSWALLISRSIHAESLVGDRQFWLTRPYGWKKLLAAKALFVAAFIVAPLLAMQCAVLLRAGLNPLASVGGIAFNLVLIVGILLAPMMAVAAVTADFVQMALSLVAVVALAVARVAAPQIHRTTPTPPWLLTRLYLMYGIPFLPYPGQPGAGRHLQLTIALLLLAVSAAAILIQYARRRTTVARIILLAPVAALTVLVLGAVAHGSGSQVTDPVYAAVGAGERPPVKFTYVPEAQTVPKMKTLYVSHGEDPAGLWIILRPSGMAADRAVFTGSYPKVAITGADGFTWNVNSNEYHAAQLVPASKEVQAGFRLPKAVYDRLKMGPVTIRLRFELMELQATGQERLPMPQPGQDAVVPGYGVCGRNNGGDATIQCRSALKQPQLTYASADYQDGPCAAGQTGLQPGHWYSWAGSSADRDPAEFGISPVVGTSFGFSRDENNATGGKVLCSGSMITLTQYRVVRRVETETVMSGFVLPED
jgi:hypothetical protein